MFDTVIFTTATFAECSAHSDGYRSKAVAVIMPRENILVFKNYVFVMGLVDGYNLNLLELKKTGYVFNINILGSSVKFYGRNKDFLDKNQIAHKILTSRHKPVGYKDPYFDKILYFTINADNGSRKICEQYWGRGHNIVTIKRFNRRFNVVLHCDVQMNSQTFHGALLPRSELLVFNNRIYEVTEDEEYYYDYDDLYQSDSDETDRYHGYHDLICIYNDGCALTVDIKDEYQPHYANRKYVVEIPFTVATTKNNRVYRYGICYNGFFSKKKKDLVFDNDKLFKVRRIQRFLRAKYTSWRSKQRLALAMALHPRLGHNSPMATMPPDIVARFC